MTQKTSAARYARALLDVALAEADPRHVEEQLAAVVDLFRSHDDLWAVMTNPAVSVTKKRAIVEALLPKLALGPVLQKLLLLLASRDRIRLLPDLLEAYRTRLLDHLRIVRATVTTAVPLTVDQAQRVQQSLAALTGRTVQMSTAADPSLMGGVIARIGSTVYDGSIKRQLERLKEELTQSGDARSSK